MVTLALIGVAFTVMFVGPFASYVQTSLLGVQKAGASMSSLTCGAAGIEYTLWRLEYEAGFADSLTPESPSTSFDFPCDDATVPITVVLPPQPSSLPDYLTDYAYADIVTVMDVSSSISSSEMSAFKQGAHAIVDGFNLDENGERYRIGLAKFGRYSVPVVSVTNNPSSLHDGINSLASTSIITCLFQPEHLACGTNIVAGIDGGAAQFDTGLGDRNGIPNLMIFLTDGNDNMGNSISNIEAASSASGAEIFAVGIDDVNIDTLNAIASEPDEDHVFYADNFEELLDLINDIVTAVTEGGVVGTIYDIETTTPDGTIIRVRSLLTPDGDVIVLSYQEI